jgi:osmotically-inducible protein OsmY
MEKSTQNRREWLIMCRILIVTPLLSSAVLLMHGCAAAVVGGAATTAVVAADPRTAGTIFDDEMIEFKVIEAFYDKPELSQQSHLNVTSYNGQVLLTGEATGEPIRQRIEDLARTVPKVQGVHNEMTIAAPSSVLTRSSDSWITAKVTSRLAAAEEVRSVDIKVVTENGTVYLMGLVSREEASRATEVVRQTSGVQRVVKLFEYTKG